MNTSFKFLIFVLAGALCLMFDAFYNGFPIVYSDTSTYIVSGFEFEPPFDRPITYGLFLRLFSLNGLSLWFVCFFQSLILSYLIFLLVRLTIGEKSFLQFGLLTIIFLSLFTGLSWTVSQLMPDVFTSIALLCTALILLGTFKKTTSILLYILFFISVAMHMSHVVLFSLILTTLIGLKKFVLPKKDYPKSIFQVTTLLLFTITTIVTMGSAIAKSKHVFFMGAMVEHGIVKKYLDDTCDYKQFKLCAYKDSLPDKAYKFIWDEKSPFYKIGGWKETKSEFDEIIYGTLTQPKYIGIHIQESFKATLQQLALFAIGDGNGSFLKGTLLYERVAHYFPNDLTYYCSSKQNKNQLDFITIFNSAFAFVIVSSFLLLPLLLTNLTHILNSNLKLITILFFIGILLNAWDCGTFANASDRLGCKIVWLIPFVTMIMFWRILQNRKRNVDQI